MVRPPETLPTQPDGLPLAEAMARSTARLREAGIEDAQLDAEMLLRHATGWDQATLLSQPGRAIAPDVLTRFFSLTRERARRRPLQHLTGNQAFWRHEFLVTSDVLIPRPETELLVEAAIEVLRDGPGPTVVDVGTGSEPCKRLCRGTLASKNSIWSTSMRRPRKIMSSCKLGT